MTRVLPAADQYAQLATAGNRLVLRAPGGGPGCRVVTTTVDPVGLELGQSTSASCGRPLFDGQRAAPDLAYDPRDSTESRRWPSRRRRADSRPDPSWPPSRRRPGTTR